MADLLASSSGSQPAGVLSCCALLKQGLAAAQAAPAPALAKYRAELGKQVVLKHLVRLLTECLAAGADSASAAGEVAAFTAVLCLGRPEETGTAVQNGAMQALLGLLSGEQRRGAFAACTTRCLEALAVLTIADEACRSELLNPLRDGSAESGPQRVTGAMREAAAALATGLAAPEAAHAPVAELAEQAKQSARLLRNLAYSQSESARYALHEARLALPRGFPWLPFAPSHAASLCDFPPIMLPLRGFPFRLAAASRCAVLSSISQLHGFFRRVGSSGGWAITPQQPSGTLRRRARWRAPALCCAAWRPPRRRNLQKWKEGLRQRRERRCRRRKLRRFGSKRSRCDKSWALRCKSWALRCKAWPLRYIPCQRSRVEPAPRRAPLLIQPYSAADSALLLR